MYLKRLELQGFKSFPEKIKLEFNKGVTAVVGPNGSGKSNIGDAVRWVLGEQSAKALRGAKMEDVIFAGTASRRPLGFAEVSLILDNSDRMMNIDYAEVCVTRAVYRSGESQYKINGSACRLKDIHELFMDTGIGREGYSIIGQGRVDEILSVKSEDRRLLLEEAAGIIKYRIRKSEAESKLERERQNLIRVNDIITEIGSQLEPLFEQSEKAKKYLALYERQKLTDINVFLLQTVNIDNELLQMQRGISDVTAQISKETGANANALRLIETNREAVSALQAESDILAGLLMESRIAEEQKEHDIKLQHQSISFFEEEITRLNENIANGEAGLATLNESKSHIQAKQNANELEISTRTQELDKKQTVFEEISKKLSNAESMIDRFSSDYIELMREESAQKAAVQRLTSLYEQLDARNEQISEEKSVHLSKLHDLKIKLLAREKALGEAENDAADLKTERVTLEAERRELDKTLQETKVQADANQNKLRDAESRRRLLIDLEERFEGYGRSVAAVLNYKREYPGEFPGVLGAVGELIDVPRMYVTAIETALGYAVQNIITTDENETKKAINYLKQQNKGRATFLPLTTIKPRELSQSEKPRLSEKGVVGTGKSLIRYDSQYEDIMSNLLGRVLVMDNLDNAIAFSKRHDYAYKIVTLEGDLISAGGAITGGSMAKNEARLLGRSHELAELKTMVEDSSRKAERFNKTVEKAKYDREIIFKLIDENLHSLQEKEIEKASLAMSLNQDKNTLKSLEEQVAELEKEYKQLTGQLSEANRDIRNADASAKELAYRIAALSENMTERQSVLQKDRENREKEINELSNLRIVVTKLTEAQKALKDQMSRVQSDIAKQNKAIEDFQNEIIARRVLIEQKLTEIDENKENVRDILIRREEIENGIKDVTKKRDDKSDEIADIERQYRERIELIGKLSSELARLETKKEQSEQETRNLYDEMWDTYEITAAAAQEYPRLEGTLPALIKDSRRLKSEIRDLGSVSVSAIEEYAQKKARHDFLTTQRDDIQLAEAKLLEIIKDLKTSMENQFKEQLALISENFNHVFREMFGGGTAHLALSDENNVLESGVDIISQPPGKNLQNMLLFSGGERTLTAIALLFGILRMKPSPFCLLDEIEAALDDANVKRFSNFLANFALETQFIIITHRKGTMEGADALYGVTMQEQGVSKLVSVKLEANE